MPSKNAELPNWEGISMLVINVGISPLVTTLAGTDIAPNVRATNEKIGYRLEAQNSCQCRTLLNFLLFFKGFRDIASLNSRGFYFAR
jgi:hypothetical protein